MWQFLLCNKNKYIFLTQNLLTFFDNEIDIFFSWRCKMKTIGERFTPKMSVVLIVLFAIFIALALFVSVTVVMGLVPVAFILLSLFIIAVSVGMIAFIVIQNKNRNKMQDKPTIVLDEQNKLNLYLSNGKIETIDLKDIKSVKAYPRHTINFYVIVLQHVWHDDGKLIFELNNGNKVAVNDVASCQSVSEQITNMINI